MAQFELDLENERLILQFIVETYQSDDRWFENKSLVRVGDKKGTVGKTDNVNEGATQADKLSTWATRRGASAS